MKNKALLILIGILNSGVAFSDVTEDFYYRPYPVLFVHGFNAINRGTWGIETRKSSATIKRISTKITGLNAASVGNTLVHHLAPGEELVANPKSFKDFWNNSLGEDQNPHRLAPFQEDGSYSGWDHTYVEVYSPYYYNESDDRDGVRYPRFRTSGTPEYENGIYTGYDIQPAPISIG